MAQKKTYIYHMLIGNDNKTELDFFMYAGNAGLAVDFCKDKYKDKKYNSYQAVKVGLSHYLRETQIIPDGDAVKLRKACSDNTVKFSEREIELPRYVANTKELDL